MGRGRFRQEGLWAPAHPLSPRFPQAAEVLQQFLKSKEMVAQAVLQTDQSLTDRQREIEGDSRDEARSPVTPTALWIW